MPLSIARRIAFEILHRVETQAAYASDLLHAKLSGNRANPISPEDAALATELTLGVLRWQRWLDHVLAAHTKTKKQDVPVRIALRMGAYQLLFLDRIPAHAAVNESVELVKKAGLRSAAGFANAVLRKLAVPGASKSTLPPFAPGASAAERLAIQMSHPTWLVERWMLRFGEESLAALLAANNSPPRVSLSSEEGRWLPATLRPRSIEGFSIQDEASQMVARLLNVQAGQRVLDVCSAPGGKTLLLAQAAAPDGEVFAADLHMHRLRIMRQRLQHRETDGNASAQFRTPVRLLALDATQPLPFSAKFDCILVDATCSGTGTLARNPEIRWRLTPADLLDLQSRQRAILLNALDALAPGGRLVYSTCSLEPEENEQVVESVLAAHAGYRLADGRAALQPHLHPGASVDQLFDPRGYFRTFPHTHGTDGFFAAIIERQ